jgi:hypothetical protein
MTENNDWPAKPGVPLNPERDGAHWLKGYTEDACMWQDEGWYIPGYSHKLDAETVASRYSYLGPALTPAEVEARIATARKDGMKDAAKWHEVRSMELSGKAGVARNFRQILRQSDFHMESAAAIRALAKGEDND